MDRLIERKAKPKGFKQHKAIILSVALFAILLWIGRGVLNNSGVGVDSASVVVGKVRAGALIVSVRGPGILLPTEVRWQVAEVDGYVEQVKVKAGEQVAVGDIIMELSNPLLMQELAELEWDFTATQADVDAALIKLDAKLLDQELSHQDAHDTYLSAKMFFDAETKLLSEKKSSLSYLNYKKTEREMNSAHRRWKNELRRYTQTEQSVIAEKKALQAKLNKKLNNLQKVREQVERLTVIASMDAVIQEMPYEPGQRVATGEPLTKLAKHDELYAELRIPEIQIQKVSLNQPVLLDTRNNKIRGVVSRIDPAVNEGSVVVDVRLTESLPGDARPDLSVEGVVQIADIAHTLSVARPLFAQSETSTQVFKVSDDGKFAVRTSVTFGKGASDRIEVLQGLNAGDQIVVSDTSAWDNNTSIRLN